MRITTETIKKRAHSGHLGWIVKSQEIEEPEKGQEEADWEDVEDIKK